MKSPETNTIALASTIADPDAEYSWGESITDHQIAGIVRVHLVRDGQDAGVLVLDRAQTAVLADMLTWALDDNDA